MRATIVWAWGAAFALVSFSSGCKKSESESKPPPAASASAASGAASASAPEPSASTAASPPAKSGNMAHCPSSVAGAKTEIQDGKDAVTVKVTATDPAAVSDIRARAKVLTEQASKAAQEVKHTGSGEGGGAFGRCPVVMRNTAVTAADIENGSAITVKPSEPKELDWLRRESRDRLAELAKPGAESAGQGKMAHCPSAVQGTKTTVKDTKDGVDVTVVAAKAKDADTEKEIRERAKALVEASKQDPASVHHTGSGTGGGGFGRCPVVLKDTTVTAKDTPGGTTFSVKASSATAVADLRKEAKSRSANFTH
ncbi:hypothetical protein LVJ94_18105 [Pendulispora rubella]|uniref:Uncharacterized protein n=1 Tax=Pendulispora rubella TaxID=2741070 RepID=A0ABZ2LJ08_9BACT